MADPNLIFAKPAAGVTTAGITLAVYAPFGTDPTLTTYPDGVRRPIAQLPLVQHLTNVARQGVCVSALIDLFDDDTWLVEIAASANPKARITSCWKQQMSSWRTLAGFLKRARSVWPARALVVALEGHGAGFLPELDVSRLDTAGLTQGGEVQWEITQGRAVPEAGENSPVLPMGSPLLPMGSPLLPMGSPLLPVDHVPMSTWALSQAFKAALPAGAQRPGVIHFNNCFNMSVELLHTLAGRAEFATGYMNYNFFTAGEAYPEVFAWLKARGQATTRELATRFAKANAQLLAQRSHHPTTGGVVDLSRMGTVASRIDALARALIDALTGATAAQRPAVVEAIRQAIVQAQQYDTVAPMALEVPDELTDLASLAHALQAFPHHAVAVQPAAKALADALKRVKVYGDDDTPWIDPAVRWNFTRADLAMNILLPDPGLRGLWDWRSPYYLQTAPSPVQPKVIPFLSGTAWPRFIVEYHRDVPFRGLLPASIPTFPLFNRKYTGR